jgi:diacylglycerol O-acyltransferase
MLEAIAAVRGGGRRLSALDGSFLRLEAAGAHMHVGWSAVFAPPADGQRPSVEALRERTAGRLHEVPWSRWRLDSAPLGLSEPRWIDDPGFDIAAHVVELTDPDDPVSAERFEALRSAVLSAPLDRSRPLWQLYLVPRLADGRVGMLGKIHHALADGIAALQIAGLVVDREADAVPQAPAPWRPEGRGGPLGWALDALADSAGEGIGALRTAAAAATRPRASVRGALRQVGRVVTAVREDVLPRAPESDLNGPIGARRTLVGYHAARADLRAARAGGGTLNDVGLAVVAGALRALVLRHGDPPDAPLKTMIPVSMRRPDELAAGNRIAMVYITLPVHLSSPRERLEWVRAQMRELKHSDRPAATQTLFEAAGLLPAPLRSPVARALATPRAFNLTISQSPAPRGRLSMLGCELEDVYSVVPISQGHALAIGMVRYNQELFFGCHADPDAFPDVHQLPALLEAEVRALGDMPSRARSRRDSAQALQARLAPLPPLVPPALQ